MGAPRAWQVLATITAILLQQWPAAAESYAVKRNSPAKGTKTCIIRQSYDMGNSLRSNLQALIARDGSVSMSVRDDKYPGTTVYFLIDGRRYSGAAGFWISVDAHAVKALKADATVQYTWTRWPYRKEIDQSNVLDGFASAYAECLEFLRVR